MSLFGEESYEEEPMTLQLGPVWAPSWLAPPAASSPPRQISPHAFTGTAQSQQQQQQNASANSSQTQQQQLRARFDQGSSPALFQSSSNAAGQVHSGLSVLAHSSSWAADSQDIHILSDEPGEVSDFGSFTGGSPTIPPALPLDNASSAAQQANVALTAPGVSKPPNNQSAMEAAFSQGISHGLSTSEAYLPNGAAARPAAAAARNSLLQSVNRSVPISLDAFGEEEAEDPALDLPRQPAALLFTSYSSPALHTRASLAADAPPLGSPLSQQGFADFPSQLPSLDAASEWPADGLQVSDAAVPTSSAYALGAASATWPASNISSQLAAAPQRHAVSGPITFGAFDLGTSLQQAIQTGPPDSDSTFEVFPTAPGPEQVVPVQLPSTGAAEEDSFQAFEAAPSQGPAARQTASGPISLELFGIAQQEEEPLTFPVPVNITDGPLTFPLQASTTVLPGTEPPAAIDSPRGLPQNAPARMAAFPDAVIVPQQPQVVLTVSDSSLRQTLSGPISFEEFGVEDVDDAPLQLPPSAFNPTAAAASMVSQELPSNLLADAASSGSAFEPSVSIPPSEPSEDMQQPSRSLGYWEVLTVLMQVFITLMQEPFLCSLFFYDI